MNTVQTVQAWLQLAPSLIALIAALESLFPKKTGPQKLAAFHAVTTAAVEQTVPAPDHMMLSMLNSAYAQEQVQAMNAPESAKTVQEIA